MNHEMGTSTTAAGTTFSKAFPPNSASRPITVRLANSEELEAIYKFRHEVYASELKQHSENTEGKLRDALDGRNIFIIAAVGQDIHGFISVTPPSAGSYSLDKYFDRNFLPFSFDDSLYEIRLLTVLKEHRRSELAFLLMYSAF